MDDKARGMVLASFTGDSLALAAHWIYDVKAIKASFGRIETLQDPLPNSFHPTKNKGDFTHYGDQTLVLLESIAENGGFDITTFYTAWKGLFSSYQGYVDQATRVTLARFSSGYTAGEAGSSSDELGGVARIAPIVYACRQDFDCAETDAVEQTKMTHNNRLTFEATHFFVQLTSRILNGESPVKAIDEISRQLFEKSAIYNWVQIALASKESESVPIIGRFGQSCHMQEAFPGVIHLIAKYENDLKEALVQSVMAGGDSAARAMVVGMALGAHLGTGQIEDLIPELSRGKYIAELLDKIP